MFISELIDCMVVGNMTRKSKIPQNKAVYENPYTNSTNFWLLA